MKIKKIFTILLIVISVFILNSCGKDDDIEYKYEKISFQNLTPSYYKMNATYLNTYYVDNSEIKYVDVTNFFNTVDGLYQTSYFKKSVSRSKKKYSIYAYANTGDNISYVGATFDWDNDTITISNPMFFNVVYSPSAVDYLDHLSETNTKIDNVTPFVASLKDYNYNIYYKNGLCLVPLSIMNTLFLSPTYYNIYYNGEKYLGTFYDISSFDSESQLILKTNKLNSESQSEQLREETYNQLRFILDNFYGLKEYKNITDIDEILKDYKNDILSTDIEKNRNAYYKLFINYLDDLHTRIGAYSFYNSPDLLPGNWDLDKTSDARKEYKRVQDILSPNSEVFYESTEPTYKGYGDTLMLYMPSFVTASSDQLNSEDSYLKDSYQFMKWALEKNANSNYKNIVLDLSTNGGGNVAALLKVLGFMTNEDIVYANYDSLFKSKTTSNIKIDANDDDSFIDADAYDKYNWYILSSYNTFSAANSCVAMAKSFGVNIIGQKSGGGMCSVLPLVLADSTTIEISSNNLQVVLFDNKYEFIEGGIEPDLYIDYDKFYNIQYLDKTLNDYAKGR